MDKKPFDVFCDYFQLSCDHHVYPSADEGWDGAVEIIADYMVNCVLLDYDEDMHPDVWEAYRKKIIDKFKVDK